MQFVVVKNQDLLKSKKLKVGLSPSKKFFVLFASLKAL